MVHDEIAAGGMGTVHLGRLRGAAGFSRIVAIKKLNPQLAKDREFLMMFLDEARLAGRVRHPNVVPTFDVVEQDGEVLIIMEYVHGESLARLTRATTDGGAWVAPRVASAIVSGLLYGLHAAHEATDEQGGPLRLVHRDVSPQNVLVGADGMPRVVDFGVAKAAGRLQTTSEGRLKGKLSYMAPEQIQGERVDRRMDVYAAGVVLWETLTGKRLFQGNNEANTMNRVLLGHVPAPSSLAPGVPAALDDVVGRALSRLPRDRFATAREMGAAVLAGCPAAAPHEVAEWVEACAHEGLSRRAARVAELESITPPSITTAAVGAPSAAHEPATQPDAFDSHVSNISVSLAHPPPVAAWRRRMPAVAVSAAALAGLLLMGVAWRTRSDGHSGIAGPAVAAPAQLIMPPSISSGASSSSAAPSASDEPEPVSARAPVRGSAVTRTHPSPAHGAASSRPANCNVPYNRDADGRKIWKRECLVETP